MTTSLPYILMFLGTFVLDVLWALYTKAVAGHRSGRAGTLAAALYIVSGCLVTAYTTDHWLLLPAAFGAFLGTYVGTWWDKPKPSGPAVEYCDGCRKPHPCPCDRDFEEAHGYPAVCDVNDYVPIDPPPTAAELRANRMAQGAAEKPWQESAIEREFRSRL